jgi:hypothetical protein
MPCSQRRPARGRIDKCLDRLGGLEPAADALQALETHAAA